MTVRRIIIDFGKLILAALVSFIGMIIGGMAAGILGVPTPPMPVGAETGVLLLLSLLSGFFLAALLAYFSRRLSGGFLVRWLALFLFTYIAYNVNTYLEASIFTIYAGSSLYNLITGLFSTLLITLLVAGFFRPVERGEGFARRAAAFFQGRGPREWGWRLALVFLSFPAAYTVFGLIVAPYVTSYYLEQAAGLVLPGWSQIIPILLLRSLLFLPAFLLLLIAWNRSRTSLFVALGVALFLLVGGLNLMVGYWMPLSLRLPHSLEILADSFAHAAAVVFLLVSARPAQAHVTPEPAVS